MVIGFISTIITFLEFSCKSLEFYVVRCDFFFHRNKQQFGTQAGTHTCNIRKNCVFFFGLNIV